MRPPQHLHVDGGSNHAAGGVRPSRAALAFNLMHAMGCAAFVAQLLIDSSHENLVAATLIVASSTLTLVYLRGTRAFDDVPLSSFALLGLCVTTQWGAMVAQSCAWTAVAENLREPITTLGWLALFQCVALGSHWLYRSLDLPASWRGALSNRLLAKLGLFDVALPVSLWIMGVTGFAALFAPQLLPDRESVVTKVLDGFRFLAWAPFIIPILHQRHGQAYCNMRRQGVALGVYLLSAIALGMSLNMRTVMFSGLTTMALLFLLLMFRDERPAQANLLWRAAPALLLCGLLVGYAADLATAMVIARGQRSNASPSEMLEQTLYALFDRRAILAYRDNGFIAATLNSYDEQYIANPIVARFVETKFHDNMFFLIKDLQPQDVKALRKDTVDRIAAILPEPLMRPLGLVADKAALKYSSGDYLDYLRYGAEVGGFKIGSIFASIVALFGYYSIPLYSFVCMLVFLVWDSLTRDSGEEASEIAPMAMLMAWPLFLGALSSESLSNVLAFLLRAFPQSVLLYAAVLALSKMLSAPFALSASRWPADSR